jgi:transcription elongation factor GreA-like protein
MDNDIPFSGVRIDFNKLNKSKISNFNELIISSAAVMKRQDKMERLEIVNTYDLLKDLDRNIFQQEMRFLFLFLKEFWGGDRGISDDYFYSRGPQIINKNEGLSKCLLSSQEVHLNLNTLND